MTGEAAEPYDLDVLRRGFVGLNYRLVDRQPVQCTTLEEVVAVWRDQSLRRVSLDHIDGLRISTVFLVVDHSHGDEGPPVLFETMVFVDDASKLARHIGRFWENHRVRYSTWDDAKQGHDEIVDRLRAWLKTTDASAVVSFDKTILAGIRGLTRR